MFYDYYMFQLPYDYIRGLVDGEGTFTFSTSPKKLKDGTIIKVKVPAFSLRMHNRDEYLIRAVRVTLGLNNSVYTYHYISPDKRGIKRGPQSVLIVREFPQIKEIIIPFFYKRLYGYKGKQFIDWLEKMNDKDTTEWSKFLFRIY